MSIVKSLLELPRRVSRQSEYDFAKMSYPKLYRSLPINCHLILLESQHGGSFQGNIFYLLRELEKPEYNQYARALCVTKRKVDEARQFLELHNIKKVELVILSSHRYFEILASAKYLINDNTFLPFFIKKPGQVYLNTWHGTPLKTLGKASRDSANTIGITQRNFCLSDYLLAPNEFTLRHLRDDYMMANLTNTQFLLDGYPRNEAFFDDARARQVRIECGINSSQRMYAYMPTWRSYGGFDDTVAEAYLLHHLCELDSHIPDDMVMFVNLHPVAQSKIDFKAFQCIRPFPTEYETYEFLNACDCLITDYSSVMFDFAITGKPIILFEYDAEQYEAARGMYFNPEVLGFPIANSLSDLYKLIAGTVCVEDTREQLINTLSHFDSPGASARMLKLLLFAERSYPEERLVDTPNNGKPNILIYSGDLSRNGITSSLKSLSSYLDYEHNNYIVTLRQRFPKSNLDTLLQLSEAMPYILTVGKMDLSPLQKVVHFLFNRRLCPFPVYHLVMKPAYQLDAQRLYGFMKIDAAIHFSGYEYRRMLQFDELPGEKSIFVHNNMVEEIKRKDNQRRSVLKYIYRAFDHVALVTEDMVKPTEEFCHRTFDIVPNTIDYENIIEKSKQPLSFDDYTRSNIPFESLVELLDSDVPVIVTIGRFSPEKGHRRLIDAFGKVLNEAPGAYLVIIGGRSYSDPVCSFEGLAEYVQRLPYSNRITLIVNMSNPYALLKKCTGLILPSYHEGFGLVLAEADILGVPCCATDIPGPKTFMEEHDGYLFPNSDDGVLDGIRYLLSDQAHCLDVDYEAYNHTCVEAFERLLPNGKGEEAADV